MNRHTTLTPVTMEAVRYSDWSYMVTPADFAGGCLVVTDAQTGKQTATGRNTFGAIVTSPLDVLLCKGCDREIDNGVCSSCELVFLEDDVTLDEGRASVWA